MSQPSLSPLDVLREALDCPYRDAVDPGMHSGCRYCAEMEDRGVPVALDDVQALVDALEGLRYRTTGCWCHGKDYDNSGHDLGCLAARAALARFADSPEKRE